MKLDQIGSIRVSFTSPKASEKLLQSSMKKKASTLGCVLL